MNRLTPLEIQRQEFRRRVQGLDAGEVREFLARVAEQAEEEARQRGELRAQLEQLVREVEDLRRSSLAADEALRKAQAMATATITQAESDAERILAQAQTLADRLVDEAMRRAENLELVVSQLRGRRRAARIDLKRVAEVLLGAAKDDEAAEVRETQEPSLAFLRPRTREGSGER
jgi:cell division initiation protein